MATSLPRPTGLRFALLSLSVVIAAEALTASTLAQQALYNPTVNDLMTYYPGRTRAQDLRPPPSLRGVGIDGTLRQPAALGWAMGANSFESSRPGDSRIGNVWLQTGTYTTTDVDISLPAPGFRWTVGRSYNNRQDDSGRYDSNGYQGRNWAQLSQPEIVMYDDSGDSNDRVYIVYGADRFLEFKWSSNSVNITGHKVSEFRGINGTAGVIQRNTDTNDANSSPDTWTYYDQTGTQTVFFGFDSGGSGNARGQLWKVIDPAGNTAYVGDASTASTAISSGYDSSGRILYAYDSADRRYTYTYSSHDSVTRVDSVKAETHSGGTWASSPTGIVEVARVEYGYYTGSDSNGDNGCLKTVTLTTPLTDSGINDVRKKYYRYYTSAYNSSTNPGHAYELKLVVGYEGYRRRDWDKNGALDDDFLSESTSTLDPYSEVYLEYEDSSHKVRAAFFNGECGCSGGANGTYQFSYTDLGAEDSFSGTYNTRTVIIRPDGTYKTQYFDWPGQPLSSVITDTDPADLVSPPSKTWVTELARNTNGVVTNVYSPAVNSLYTHSSGAIAHAGTGAISVVNRVSGGDLDSFFDADRKQDAGAGSDSNYVRSTKYLSTNPTLTVGSYSLIRPMLEKTRNFKIAAMDETTAADYDETVLDYTFWSSTSTDPLKLRPKVIGATYPKVADTNNGRGTGAAAIVAKRYLRQDGTTAFTLQADFSDAADADKIYTYTQYTNGQLTKQIVDVATNGSFASGDDPNTDFGITETSSGKNLITTYEYDAQGRVTKVVPPEWQGTNKYRKTYYSKLVDGRLVTISLPLVDTVSSTVTYFGPASYTVSNHAGKVEFSGTVAIAASGVTTAVTSWVTESSGDPIGALDSSLKPLFKVSTNIYDSSGTRPINTRMYTTVPGSGAGSAGTNYDETTHGYDSMGRRWRTKTPTGDITRMAFDELGRTIKRYLGTNDHAWYLDSSDPLAEPSGTDNMVKVEELAYDEDTNVLGNGQVTTRTLFVEGTTTGDRVTTFKYDGRGQLIVQVGPQAPYTVMKYDNLGRSIASGQYSSSSGLLATTDPTSTTTNRVALSETSYDEMGRAFKSTRHSITQSDGSDAASLSNLSWFDSMGRVIKTRGEQLTKTFYDRLGRATNRFVLAKVDEGDTVYNYAPSGVQNDARNVAGDTVLEENQTYFDDATGNTLMTVRIQRHPNDTSTTTALDTDTTLSLVDYTTSGGQIKGRAQITAMFYDTLNRLTDTMALGTNGGSNYNRSGASLPSRDDTHLITSYSYNDNGTTKDVTDPRGLVTRTLYDDAGRKTATIANYVNGTPSGNNNDDDVYTRYEYANGLMTEMWVDFDGDGVKDTGDQRTKYIHGSTKATPSQMKIASGSLLRAVIYPDSSNTGTTYTDIDSDSSTVVSYAYNAQGQQTYMKDQAGNVIETDYDTAGRQTERRVTTLAGGFDGAVKRIETTYLSRGLVDHVTQYDNATVGSGSVTDDTEKTYDGLGNVTAFIQDVDSAIGGSGRASFEVDYGYSVVTPTGGRVTSRRDTMTFPDGTRIDYSYGTSGSIADTVVRVDKMSQTKVDLATYDYLGAGQVVTTTLNEAGTSSTVFNSGSTTYPDYDNFNRVIESIWKRSRAFYDQTITYDRDSGITSGVDAVLTDINGNHQFDAVYTNDNLNRLLEAKEGKATTGSITTCLRDEQFTLSQTGNWANHLLDNNCNGTITLAAGDLNDTGTFDAANKWLTRDTDSNSSVNYTLAYDGNGSMTDDGQSYKYVWDAFGRLVTVNNQSNALVAEFRYNGYGYRLSERTDVTRSGGGAPNGVTDSYDPVYYTCYDDRWRPVAVYRDTDTNSHVKTRTVYHNAGANGLGGSSYIDLVVLRDRDANTNWYDAADTVAEERNYYCQNQHADVVVMTTAAGLPIENIRYSAYGRPSSYALADLNHDGVINGTGSGTDYAGYFAILAGSGGNADTNFDGNWGTFDDDTDFSNSYTAGSTGGVGVLSRALTDNRIGYAGYRYNPAVGLYDVRHRDYRPDLGRWLSKDPAGYQSDSSLYAYSNGEPLSETDSSGLCSSSTCNSVGKVDIVSIPAPKSPYKRCQENLNYCIANDDRIKRILDELRRRGIDPHINCASPDDSVCANGPCGYTKPGFLYPTVTLCSTNKCVNQTNLCDSLYHELYHVRQAANLGAWDRSRISWKDFIKLWNRPDTCMELEYDDYSHTGLGGHQNACSAACTSCGSYWESIGGSDPQVAFDSCMAWCRNWETTHIIAGVYSGGVNAY